MKIKFINYSFSKGIDLRTDETTLHHKAKVILEDDKKFVIYREKEQEIEEVIEFIKSAESIEEVNNKYNSIPQLENDKSETKTWNLLEL